MQPIQQVESYESIETRIGDAIETLKQRGEENPNLAAAAREFNLPPYRLRARWGGRQSKMDRPGTNKKLTDDQELAVCLYLDRLDSMGAQARMKMVTGCANHILASAHTDPKTEPPVVGEHWTQRFLDRHPEYHVIKSNTIDIDRQNAHNPEAFRRWFREFKKVCDKHGIQPRDIYNFDETGFRIGIGKDQWVITRDPSRKAYLGSSTNRELVTVCETISADGDALPPMIILSGVLHQAKWFTKLPAGYLVGVSDTGYSNDQLSMDWLAHFDRFSCPRRLGAYRMLIFDGYGGHCTKQFIEYCDDRKIVPFVLPSHTSHLLQPLDVVVFQPYKHYHAEAVDAATRTGCTDFDKAEFLDAIDDVRCQTFKPSTIISAFRNTGLVPYNPDVVLTKLRELEPTPPPPSTPPPPDASPEVPLTIRSLKRQFQSSYNEVSRLEGATPSLKRRLKTALTGGLAQAQAGARAVADLEETKAAEKARRQRSRRTHLQRGGVLYAEDARDMVVRKEEEDAKKAREALERAQSAIKRAEKAERKPFLDAVKKSRKKIQDTSRARKKLMKELCLDIRKEVRKRAAAKRQAQKAQKSERT